MSNFISPAEQPPPASIGHTELHFFGARRSGNHAVLGWIMANAESNGLSTEHFNDIHDTMTTPPKTPEYGTPDLVASADTNVAIYSYQDISVDDISGVNFYVGAPEEKITLSVLRDLPNLIASRIAMYDDLDRRGLSHRSVRQVPLEAVTDMWVGYASKYIEAPDPNAGTVNFPLWFQSKTYRDAVYACLGMGNSHDAGLENVADFGFGSSFDFRNFNGRAQEMKVLERWRQYQDDPRYTQAISSHPDAAQLADEFQQITRNFLVDSET